jgi:uncharacterized membrane protein
VTLLQNAAARIEKASGLDGSARAVQRVARKALPPKAADLLRGAPIGHPLHPALVAVPIGSWLSATVLDLTGGDAKAARRLVALGVLAALPTAAAGAADWSQVDPVNDPEAVRTGFVHAGLNDLALMAYAASWVARGHGHRGRGAVLALGGSVVLAASGWLGGHLVFNQGVGVSQS